MRRLVLLVLAVSLLAPGGAAAEPFTPPAGKVFYGVTDGDSLGDFERRTGKHPAVWQQWIRWGGGYEHAFRRAVGGQTRLMLHLGTAAGQNMAGRISPGAIARGAGDGYLMRLGRRIAEHGKPVYLRPLGEMNNCDSAYSSHDCDGARRGPDHAPARFKQAWRRMVIVIRGGSVAAMNERLRRLGMPGVATGSGELPRPQVAFVWSPMTGGSPMIAALRPQVFWPGSRFVDWVGTSFYSRFPNFQLLEPFYRRFAVRYGKPFAFAEWAMWGSDDPGFARRLLSWVAGHERTRMMLYNQGKSSVGPFRLRFYPRAAQVLRNAMRSARYAGLAAEYRRR